MDSRKDAGGANINAGAAITGGTITDTLDVTSTAVSIGGISISTGIQTVFNVMFYGAIGNGIANDTIAIQSAISAASTHGGTVYFPDPNVAYLIMSTISIPNNVRLLGSNKFTTQLKLGFAGDMFYLGNGAQLEQLYLNGNSQVGRGIYIKNTNGQQTIHNCNITNFAAPCVEFEPIGGSGISFVNILAYRSDGYSGGGNYSIKIAAPVIGASASTGSTSTSIISTTFGDTTHATGYYNGACIGFDSGSLSGTFQTISASVNNGSGSWTFTTSAFSGAPGSGDTFHTFVNQAVPRKFIHFESAGDCSFDFGMGNDTFVTGGGYIADLNFTTQSRGTEITGCRLGGSGKPNLTVYGYNNVITGCDIGPQITLGSGAEQCIITGNNLNNPPIIDSSGAGAQNAIDSGPTQFYTPVLSFGGTVATIGNGTLTGLYLRQGRLICVTVDVTWGSTSNLNSGSGPLTITLPTGYVPTTTGPAFHVGIAELYDPTGNQYYVCMVRAVPSSSTVTITCTGVNEVTQLEPVSIATLWHVRFTLTYPI